MTVSADAIEQAKADLRRAVRDAVRSLGEEARREQSARACAHALTWRPLSAAGVVLAYWPIPGEPDTRPLIQELVGRETTVCLPRVDWDNHRIVPVPVGDPERDLGPPERGVRQPRADLAPLDPNRIEAVVVPGLAFDETGARLGRGGGFYDRWLADRPDHRATIGIALACQVVGRIPTAAHDQHVDAVATPGGLIGPRMQDITREG